MLDTAQLRTSVTGTVIGPGDAEYDRARTITPGGIDRRPAAVVRVADSKDVAQVLAVARDSGLPLAVRSGGHSIHGVCEGGIVLHVGDLRSFDIDADGRTAWAGSGLSAGAYTNAAGAHGLATGFGDTGSVGIGGITLGGGIGFLSRKYGLTIDSLLAAEVVTADGEVLHVDADNHPDLFWAIRGGGGNFGVVTRVRFRLHEVPTIVGGMLILPATPEVIASFVAEAHAAPEELSTIANVMAAPPMPFLPPEVHGKLVVMALMVYAGDAEAGQVALAPFRALATPLVDMLKPMRYPEIYGPEPEDYHPVSVGRNLFLDDVTVDRAAHILERIQASTAMMSATQLRVLGGAVSRVAADGTAYAHRDRRIMANVAAVFGSPADAAPHTEWVVGLTAALQDGAGAYVNFLNEDGEERIHEAYPESTYERLRRVKRRYDPGNLFRLNQNIPPA
ncbi:MAG TPA: FAD-binding oxidoreductase [Jiangellales bacterium]|nr:FAD-binding oxidoreductase [Jiangellales bacterium]